MKGNSIYIKSFIWNMLGGLLNAGQSFLLILVITWTIGIEAAGFFSFAFALANQFLSIGQYGMRNYQVTDSNSKYNFSTYLKSRYVTTFIMVMVVIAYCFSMKKSGAYSIQDIIVFIMLCVWKLIDSLDDVFQGLYQQKGRLDIGAFWYTVRTGISIAIFCLGIIYSKNMLMTISIVAIFNVMILPFAISRAYPQFRKTDEKTNIRTVIELLKSVFPLFVSTFTSLYIINGPKYAIEAELTNTIQAIYGYISMPVMFVTLISSFFLQPLLSKMSIVYAEKNKKEFVGIVLKQFMIIVLLGIVIMICGYLLGIPVLSLLYNIQLDEYKTEFLILLLSGVFTFLASGLLYNILVIMRCTKVILITYFVLAIIMFMVSRFIIRVGGLFGATIVVLCMPVIMSMVFTIVIVKHIRNREWNVYE